MLLDYTKYVLLSILLFNILTTCNNKSKQNIRQELPHSEFSKSGNNSGSESSGENIFTMVSDKDDLSTFVKALKAAGLEQTLTKKGTLTVFAPTNEVFNNLPDGIMDVLMKPESKERLAALLKVHVVEGYMRTSDFKDKQLLSTEEGIEIEVIKDNGTITVSQAKIIKPNIQASNGVIHIVDQFMVHLQPPSNKQD